MIDIPTAVVTTVISSAVSTSIALYINRRNNLKSLDDQLDNILKIAIQYPYLENDDFTHNWSKEILLTDERYLRYDIYCNLLFNFLERYCKFYSFNEDKIQKELNVRDWIRTHRKCWQSPAQPFENIDSYDKKFRKLIDSFIK